MITMIDRFHLNNLTCLPCSQRLDLLRITVQPEQLGLCTMFTKIKFVKDGI